jgi:hypothetical protein
LGEDVRISETGKGLERKTAAAAAAEAAEREKVSREVTPRALLLFSQVHLHTIKRVAVRRVEGRNGKKGSGEERCRLDGEGRGGGLHDGGREPFAFGGRCDLSLCPHFVQCISIPSLILNLWYLTEEGL